MSERVLAIFLHNVLAGQLVAVGPVRDAASLQRLLEQPALRFHDLLTAHVDALLATLPDGDAVRPGWLPTTTLWLAAVLNNLVWASRDDDPQLLNVSLRLARALPLAHELPAALAGHSLLQPFAQMRPATDWRPVLGELWDRHPLTAAWLPRCDQSFAWDALLGFMHQPALQILLRDRWLSLTPASVDAVLHAPDLAQANANIEMLLTGLLEADADWLAFVLEFYEADCELQRRGSADQPDWPILAQLRSACYNRDLLLSRRARANLGRYRPLAMLLRRDPRLLRPYTRLDPRFLLQIADVLPASRFRNVERRKQKAHDMKRADSGQ